MSLSGRRFLFVDCQTTGIRPPAAHLLEIAWGLHNGEGVKIHSHLVRLPDGQSIPKIASEITGLTSTDLESASAIEDVASEFAKAIEDVDAVVIHYAQFEKPFLLDLLRRVNAVVQLPFRVLCTHQITKRLFPNLPSQNIRACAGFFGPPIVGLNRASVFVRATEQIWRGLTGDLEKLELVDGESIEKWIADSPKPKKVRSKPVEGKVDKREKSPAYEYRLDKVTRLKLPDTPGVYRMLAKTGEVLYVGKATSLKSRVNSYFRGKKGRDARKLEMLAQVWDLQVTPCESPLEAALLESDEIKRLDPPYNVVLKTGNRHLQFYSRDFESVSPTQDVSHPIGPFRNSNWIDHLRLLSTSIGQSQFQQVFIYEIFPEEDLREGFKIFCEQQNIDPQSLRSVRSLLAYGMKLFREYEEPEELEEELTADAPDNSTIEVDQEDLVITPEDLAGKFERLLRRAAAEKWRIKKLTKLLNAKVRIQNRVLEFQGGLLGSQNSSESQTLPWVGLEIAAYDRMSILLSEITRSDYQIV